MLILGIDPGPTQSGWCAYNTAGKRIFSSIHYEIDAYNSGCGMAETGELREIIRYLKNTLLIPMVVAVEDVTFYQMKDKDGNTQGMGRSTIDTSKQVGRIQECCALWGIDCNPMTRPQINLQLCGISRAKKPQTNARLRELHGGDHVAKGKKAAPGPLYGISGHAWDALAVAVAWNMKREEEERNEKRERCLPDPQANL